MVVIMMFGLKNVSTTFQRMVMEIFEEFILNFMQVFLDDFALFNTLLEHIKCLQKCCMTRLSLNPAKCAIAVRSDVLLGHAISKEDIAIVTQTNSKLSWM